MAEWRNPAAGGPNAWGPSLPHPITVVHTSDPERPWMAFPMPHGTLPAERREDGFWQGWIDSLGSEAPRIGIGNCPQDAVAGLLYAHLGNEGPKLLAPAMSERAVADVLRRVLTNEYLRADLKPDPDNPEAMRADFGDHKVEEGELVVLDDGQKLAVMIAMEVNPEEDRISWNVIMTVERPEEKTGPTLVKDPPKPKRKPAAKKKAAKKTTKKPAAKKKAPARKPKPKETAS